MGGDLLISSRLGLGTAATLVLKATEGSDYINPQFERDWREIADQPLVRGAYHYAHPNQNVRRKKNSI